MANSKMQNSNNSRIVKKANRFLLISALRDNDFLTVEELVQKTRLSRPTVLKLLAELEQEHIVEKAGFGESMGGRQPMLYALNLHYHYAVGIDFEFPPMRVAFSDLKGNLVFSKCWEQQYGDTMESIVQTLIDTIKEGLSTIGADTRNIIGIGMGIPGHVDINENVPISFARLPKIKNVAINKLIEEELHIPTYIRNDAHLLALSDRNQFLGRSDSMLYIAYRTGIGMAIFENSLLYEGECGNSGYLGHTTFDRNGDLCMCGNHGCLELYCSKVTIVKKYIERTGSTENVSFRKILLKANEGDTIAQEIISDAAQCFGIAIANAVKLFDISLVVIGDLPSGDGDLFLEKICETVNVHVHYSKNKKISVLRGSNDEEAYAMGGCIFIIDQFFKTPKLKLNVN